MIETAPWIAVELMQESPTSFSLARNPFEAYHPSTRQMKFQY